MIVLIFILSFIIISLLVYLNLLNNELKSVSKQIDDLMNIDSNHLIYCSSYYYKNKSFNERIKKYRTQLQ